MVIFIAKHRELHFLHAVFFCLFRLILSERTGVKLYKRVKSRITFSVGQNIRREQDDCQKQSAGADEDVHVPPQGVTRFKIYIRTSLNALFRQFLSNNSNTKKKISSHRQYDVA